MNDPFMTYWRNIATALFYIVALFVILLVSILLNVLIHYVICWFYELKIDRLRGRCVEYASSFYSLKGVLEQMSNPRYYAIYEKHQDEIRHCLDITLEDFNKDQELEHMKRTSIFSDVSYIREYRYKHKLIRLRSAFITFQSIHTEITQEIGIPDHPYATQLDVNREMLRNDII